MSQTGTAPTDNVPIGAKREPPRITPRLAATVYMAVLNDYLRPEVREDYRRWKKERGINNE